MDCGSIAQSGLERTVHIRQVGGSNPLTPTKGEYYMSRMRFHPQKHNSRSIFNRGMSEFFHTHYTKGEPIGDSFIGCLIIIIAIIFFLLFIAFLSI